MSEHQQAATASRRIPLPADEAWELVTDVRNHARWIPWTRIHTPGPLRVGGLFVAASGPAWLPGGGFLDRMVVERLDAPSGLAPADTELPGRAELPARAAGLSAHSPAGEGTGVAVFRKMGPVLLGTAEVHVRATGPCESDVTWLETVHVKGLPPRLTAAPLRVVLAAMTRLALRRIAAEVEAAARP